MKLFYENIFFGFFFYSYENYCLLIIYLLLQDTYCYKHIDSQPTKSISLQSYKPI